MEKSKIVLAIEAAIRGGSVSLLDGETEILSWHGVTLVSRAEDLLVNISGILEQSGFDKSQIDMIAVSNGPGSFTGIRIGLATALGLKNSLGIPCFGVSLLAAVAATFSEGVEVAVAVPVGRTDICWQIFGNDDGVARPLSTARSADRSKFVEFMSQTTELDFLIQKELLAALQPGHEHMNRVHPIGQSLACAIGRAAQNVSLSSNMEPFYVHNARSTLGVS